ncbi:MAG TPA: hypothetical protein VIC60_04055 [Thermomicrobiales bacterium]|jgi:Mn-dependent DtxR family transcriptional regulator
MAYIFLTRQDEAFLGVLDDLQRTSRVTPIDISIFAGRLALPVESVVQIAQCLAERDLVTLRSVCAVAPTPFGAHVARSFRRRRLHDFARILRGRWGEVG